MSLTTVLRERFVAWALRAKPPEPEPVILNQRRVYVLPTRAGLAFALALLVMLLGAINYNLSLGHALVFLLAGLGLVAIMHTFRNLVGIEVATGRAEPVFAGETAHFALLFHNPRQEERRRLRIAIEGGSEDFVDIPGGATAATQLGLPAPRRGWLTLPRITVQTTYPLGLIRAWSYAAPAMRCLIYPRPAETAPPLPLAGGDRGGRLQGQRGGEDFAGLRGHQLADPPRHVAWKAAARQGPDAPLLTKLFVGASTDIVWLDWEDTPASADTETRLAILARWVLDAAEAGLAWGLRLPGSTVPPAGGDDQLHAGLQALALHGT